MTRKYSSISVETTLASGINTTQTTMQVVSSAAATSLLGGQTLAAGNVDIFTVVIDPDTASEEIVFITDVSGDTFTVSRGQAGTGSAGVSGIAHSAGATVRHVLTSSDLDFFRNGVATADAAIAKSTLTAKGNILTATASATPAVIGVGTNGQYLKADSTTATGLAWSAVSSAPKIGQVVQNSITANWSSSSNSYVDVTNANASITPTLSSSKVLVTIAFPLGSDGPPSGVTGAYGGIVRGTTLLAEGSLQYYGAGYSSSLVFYTPTTLQFLDSPATTSSVTYKLQAYKTSAATNVQISGQIVIILKEVLV